MTTWKELARRNPDAFRTPLADVVEQEIAQDGPLGPFHRYWLTLHAPHRVREYLERAKTSNICATRQGFAAMDVNDFPPAAFTARNTTASEINIIGDTANGATPQAMINAWCAIPANDARAGKMYEVRTAGIYSNTATPTVIITPRWGSSTTVATNVTLGAGPTWTTITATTNLPWRIWFEVGIRSVGVGATSATAYGQGNCHFGVPVTSSEFVLSTYMGNTAATVDTTGSGTAGCGLTMNWTWSASSASNTFTTQYYVLRSLN